MTVTVNHTNNHALRARLDELMSALPDGYSESDLHDLSRLGVLEPETAAINDEIQRIRFLLG